MNKLYLMPFYFVLTVPSYGFDSFYVYVKNTTPHVLKLPTGGSVRPNEQGIFESFGVTEPSTHIHKITVKGSIHVKNKPAQKCHVNFKTYTTLNSEMTDQAGKYRHGKLATFILVSEKDGHLICNPVAAEVSKGNSMIPNGNIVPLEKAKKSHKKWKKREQKHHQYHQCPIHNLTIDPSVLEYLKKKEENK